MRLYQEITDKIIAELEQGAVPWVKPWKTSTANRSSILPCNFVTGRAYHGINVMILWGERASKGYADNHWLTYKQAQEQGGQVRKGEKATQVVFTKKLRIKDQETEEEKQISMLRGYFVFNVAQVEGLSIETNKSFVAQPQPESATVAFIAATKAQVRDGGNEACFIPSLDLIQMPPFGSFKTAEGYWSTHLHELTHWSGHTTRLDRNLTGRFGTRAYAAEELVAELGAAFLCDHLGVEGELRHAGYLQHWLELLKHDNRAIFTAAAQAQKAADYLRQLNGEVND